MILSIYQIVCSSIFFMGLGALVHYFCTKRKWKDLFQKLVDNIILYWYVIVFLITTIFVIVNYADCIDLHFTNEFNGKNLIFLFWLAIIVFPFFDSFEAFGVSIKKRKETKEANNIRNLYHQNMAKAENANTNKGGKK